MMQAATRKPRALTMAAAMLLCALIPSWTSAQETEAERFDSGWILARLKQPVPAATPFLELRESDLLDEPMRIRGEYRRPDEDTLVRQVTAPYVETTTLKDGRATIEREGRSPRSFSMSRAPELEGLQASFGALLAGDHAALEQHCDRHGIRVFVVGSRGHFDRMAAAALNHTAPVTKVTILPRGRALGYTMVMPTEDKYSTSRNELLDQLVYALGGRVAEELVFHDPTTGASNDIQKATSIARKMVTEYGMSARVGAVRLVADDADPMTRAAGGSQAEYSDRMAHVVDQEVRLLIDDAHDECWELLQANRHILDELASRLLEKETLLEKELAEMFADVIKAPERPLWLSSDERPISHIPPIDHPEDK